MGILRKSVNLSDDTVCHEQDDIRVSATHTHTHTHTHTGDVYVVMVEKVNPVIHGVEADNSMYITTDSFFISGNPLCWWKERALEFQNLTLLAK